MNTWALLDIHDVLPLLEPIGSRFNDSEILNTKARAVAYQAAGSPLGRLAPHNRGAICNSLTPAAKVTNSCGSQAALTSTAARYSSGAQCLRMAGFF